MEWLPVAEASQVGTRPLAVTAAGIPLVIFRPTPDADPVVFADRCPHRLMPLSAGTVEDGRLRCAYHGWEFDGSGACVTVPSQDSGPPPRASLPAGPHIKIKSGLVYVAANELPSPDPTELLTNEDPALLRAWHPVGLVSENPEKVRLMGRDYVVADERTQERWGMIWLAPEEPRTSLFEDPDLDDQNYVGAWLPPARTPVSAGIVADNFLDVAHFPFVHEKTFGAAEETVVEKYDVIAEPYGCRSIQDQWFDNPEDPGVIAGLRPVRQRRRATYVYRAPFQLMLRLEELDAGAVKTILFFAQPESATSTRIYTKMLFHGIGGVPDPSADVVAREVAFEEAVLEEDLELQYRMRVPGLPLRMRDELHVRADLLGVSLRRVLAEFKTAG
ncbi:phenylpropionate dioxygenase-like ring-hydroxylating dioxygenase large terminal subunit [Actinoplanes lutulentus]|uniref:Rieske-like 2Fe-2S protein n=1 Tax=Actinoplanes lutulentus TaxID=1287878 RepID=A0A327ZKM2_9ACTN|nr:Rieske 2Fe-2S domain-containing protein [Actinoplanes lutulentus]MBB2943966.1 phenylpropionate dioxygenase-like ring-hydroxylating dioxygenase large terminal subunit [Actinoplanes lutulentus]RAK42801.1 Rieske-like 2Fe-2S protein [Actinoplanes lutulentus]